MNRKKALVAKSPKDYKLLWMVLPFIVRIKNLWNLSYGWNPKVFVLWTLEY